MIHRYAAFELREPASEESNSSYNLLITHDEQQLVEVSLNQFVDFYSRFTFSKASFQVSSGRSNHLEINFSRDSSIGFVG